MAWRIQKNKQDVPDELPELPELIETQPKKVLPTVKKSRIQVVKELPVQAIREYEDKDGTTVHFMTMEEALTEFINNE